MNSEPLPEQETNPAESFGCSAGIGGGSVSEFLALGANLVGDPRVKVHPRGAKEEPAR